MPSCDVIIVGGGSNGLAAAGRLARAGSKVLVLEHVRQGESVASAPFPAPILAAIQTLMAVTAELEPPGPGSRRIELRTR